MSAAVEATKLGTFNFLVKPFSTERVKVMICNALDQRRLRNENHSCRQVAAVQTLREFKEVSERKLLGGKLRDYGWNISKTAVKIATPRSNLCRKLDRYCIS